jgi:hypothetical protein
MLKFSGLSLCSSPVILRKLYTESSIGASYQIYINSAKMVSKKIFF